MKRTLEGTWIGTAIDDEDSLKSACWPTFTKDRDRGFSLPLYQ